MSFGRANARFVDHRVTPGIQSVEGDNIMYIHEILTLYDYNYWANNRILQTASQLSETQLDAPVDFSAGSLRATLVHTLSAEWIWRSRWQGTSPTAMLRIENFATLEAIRMRWHAEEQQMRTFLSSLSDAAVMQDVTYHTTSGKPSSQPLWQMLLHVVFHGMQHRSEMAAMLTTCGYSPGDIDFIVFLRHR